MNENGKIGWQEWENGNTSCSLLKDKGFTIRLLHKNLSKWLVAGGSGRRRRSRIRIRCSSRITTLGWILSGARGVYAM